MFVQFPYITSTNGFKSKNDVLDSQSGRYLTDVSTSDTHVLSLTSCTNSKAIGWSHKHVYGCFTNMCSRFEFVVSHKQQYQGKLQLFATDRMDFCLGGSPNQKLTSKELKSGAFAPCRWHTNQVFFFPQYIMNGRCFKQNNISFRYKCRE